MIKISPCNFSVYKPVLAEHGLLERSLKDWFVCRHDTDCQLGWYACLWQTWWNHFSTCWTEIISLIQFKFVSILTHTIFKPEVPVEACLIKKNVLDIWSRNHTNFTEPAAKSISYVQRISPWLLWTDILVWGLICPCVGWHACMWTDMPVWELICLFLGSL